MEAEATQHLIEAVDKLAGPLNKIAAVIVAPQPPQSYTLTGASDWPLLVAVGGLLLMALVAIWADLKAALKDSRSASKDELREHKADTTAKFDAVWTEIRACKAERCPPIPMARRGDRDS